MTDDHFLALSESEGFLAACTSADGYDVYEMRIAFSAFSTEFAGAPFQAELGAVFGLDFNAGLTDVGIGYDGENGVYRGDYVSLGGFFADYRGTNAGACARLRLVEKADAYESLPETPATGDDGYVLYVVLAVVAVGAAVAIWIARSRKNTVIDDDDDDDETT